MSTLPYRSMCRPQSCVLSITRVGGFVVIAVRLVTLVEVKDVARVEWLSAHQLRSQQCLAGALRC